MLSVTLAFLFVIIFACVNFFFIKKMMEEVAKINSDFFNAMMETQISYIRRVNELQKFLVPVENKKEEKILDRDNDIEKSEPEEIPLTEEMRVPIVEGVKIKFEDEEESLPIDIN